MRTLTARILRPTCNYYGYEDAFSRSFRVCPREERERELSPLPAYDDIVILFGHMGDEATSRDASRNASRRYEARSGKFARGCEHGTRGESSVLTAAFHELIVGSSYNQLANDVVSPTAVSSTENPGCG